MFNTYSDHVQDNTKAKNKMNGQNKLDSLITIVVGIVLIIFVAGCVKGCDISTQRHNEYVQICLANGGHFDESGYCASK